MSIDNDLTAVEIDDPPPLAANATEAQIRMFNPGLNPKEFRVDFDSR